MHIKSVIHTDFALQVRLKVQFTLKPNIHTTAVIKNSLLKLVMLEQIETLQQ